MLCLFYTSRSNDLGILFLSCLSIYLPIYMLVVCFNLGHNLHIKTVKDRNDALSNNTKVCNIET